MAQQRPRKFKAEPYDWHEIVELKIEGLSNLGAGIAKPNGWVVFVPFALPGEKILAKVWRNEANCSHADLVEILELSPALPFRFQTSDGSFSSVSTPYVATKYSLKSAGRDLALSHSPHQLSRSIAI